MFAGSVIWRFRIKRQAEANLSSTGRHGVELDNSTSSVGSFLHADESESCDSRRSIAKSFDVKADAIVFYCEQ